MNIQDANGKLACWAIYLSAFDFKIIYRQGEIHANAVAVSRPGVDTENLAATKQDEDRSPKTLDPYENEALFHYLKHRKHQPGISNKQLKQVTRESIKFKFENGKIITINDNLIIPKLEEREKIIEEAHYRGHYQIDSTIKSIREKYMWRH